MSDDRVIDRFAGRVFGDFTRHTGEVFFTIPCPVVGYGLGLADVHGFGEDVAVRVFGRADGFFGGFESRGGMTTILMLEIERTSTESDDFGAVFLDDIDDNMRKSKVAKLIERRGDLAVVALFVSSDDGGAQFGHFDVIETKGSGDDEK